MHTIKEFLRKHPYIDIPGMILTGQSLYPASSTYQGEGFTITLSEGSSYKYTFPQPYAMLCVGNYSYMVCGIKVQITESDRLDGWIPRAQADGVFASVLPHLKAWVEHPTYKNSMPIDAQSFVSTGKTGGVYIRRSDYDSDQAFVHALNETKRKVKEDFETNGTITIQASTLARTRFLGDYLPHVTITDKKANLTLSDIRQIWPLIEKASKGTQQTLRQEIERNIPREWI